VEVHPRERERVIVDWFAAIEAGEPFERELLLWHARRNAYRTCVVRAYPVRDDDGAVQGWVGTVDDVHERTRAERADRLRAAIGGLFRSGLARGEMYEELVQLPVPDFADLCYLYLGDAGRRVAIAHVDEALQDELRRLEHDEPLDPDGPMPAARAARTGRTVYLPSIDVSERRDVVAPARVREAVKRLAMTSAIAVPVRTGLGTVGSFLFAYTAVSGRSYDARDVELAEEIGERFAQLLEHARLDEARQHAQARVEVLARIAELAATELDVETRLQALPRVLLPALGDSCAVYVTEPDGQAVRLAAFGNIRRELHDAIGDPDDWPLLPIDSASPGAVAVRTGAPFLDETRDPSLPGTYLDGRALAAASVAGPGSVLAVPLLTPEGPLGAIAFGYPRGSGRRFTRDEVPLAEEVARRVTLLLHQAQRFERERGIAEMLQRSFLPNALPTLARHDVAVRYLPGTAGLKVGGDWYDVVPLRDGRVVVAVGDVAGHGVEAAGTMGRIRTSLRVHAREAAGPADLLDRLNQYVFDEEPDEMVTLAVLFLDPASDTVECALAGHPPPFVRGADGVREFPFHALPPLGVRRARYTETRAPVLAGEIVLLYTDGLVERRGESLDRGLERLARAMADAPAPVEGFAGDVLDRMLHGDAPADDVAIVAVSVTHEPARLRMTFEPDLGELRVLRQLLRRWASQFGADHETIEDLVLAVGEAASNAIEHASAASPGGFVVTAQRDNGSVVVEVRDFGQWHEPRVGHDGRGIALMRAIADDITIQRDDDGTSVRLRTALRRPVT
jgi:serine phosphatase RsbU (regulator of sigma subunit)/anti-sigma regulatory factor (Ser/Thr protein kinase)